MLNKNLDGITKKRTVAAQTEQMKSTTSKRLDGLIGIKKKKSLPDIPATARKFRSESRLAVPDRTPAGKTSSFEHTYAGIIAGADELRKKSYQRMKLAKKNFKKKIRKNSSLLKLKLKKSFVKSLTFLFWTLGALLLIYLSYSALILQLKPKNDFTVAINNIIPIPAVFTNQGVISYNQFQKIAMNATGDDALDKNLSTLLRNKFLKLYGIKNTNPSINELDDIAFKDEGINGTAIARITKIKNEIIRFGFEEVYQKYGDEYNDGEYISRADAKIKFNDSLIDYGGDRLSPILYGDTGYYIVDVVDNKSDPIGIKYVYIKAKNFDEYLNGEIKKIRYWKLIR